MKSIRVIALLLVSFIATGSVIYQLRNRSARLTAVATAPAIGAVPEPDIAAAASGRTVGAPGERPKEPQSAPAVERLPIPREGWGRNPFFSLEEINKTSAPPPIIAEELPPPAFTTPPALPSYSVTGIISRTDGMWAIINSHLVRPGDQLGLEIVREIKDRAVVLESEGRTRELRMGQIQDRLPDPTRRETTR